jgi:hypothetical protein
MPESLCRSISSIEGCAFGPLNWMIADPLTVEALDGAEHLRDFRLPVGSRMDTSHGSSAALELTRDCCRYTADFDGRGHPLLTRRYQ